MSPIRIDYSHVNKHLLKLNVNPKPTTKGSSGHGTIVAFWSVLNTELNIKGAYDFFYDLKKAIKLPLHAT